MGNICILMKLTLLFHSVYKFPLDNFCLPVPSTQGQIFIFFKRVEKLGVEKLGVEKSGVRC
jgi:hypothetical protein